MKIRRFEERGYYFEFGEYLYYYYYSFYRLESLVKFMLFRILVLSECTTFFKRYTAFEIRQVGSRYSTVTYIHKPIFI